MASSLRSEANAGHNSPPSVIADAIGKAVTASRPKTRYAVGFGAKPLIAARSMLPDRQYDARISRAVGLPSSPRMTAQSHRVGLIDIDLGQVVFASINIDIKRGLCGEDPHL